MFSQHCQSRLKSPRQGRNRKSWQDHRNTIMIKSMSYFVTCWKRPLDESSVTIKLSDKIIVEAKSYLEMSKERRGFREHFWQSFELERSMSSHYFWKSQNHSNKSRSSCLLKLKQELDNGAHINKTVGNVSNGGFVRRLSSRPQTAGQGFKDCDVPFARRFSVATRK